MARGPELGSPNGLVVDADGGVIVAGMSAGEVYRLANGARTPLRAPRRGQLDGVVRTRGGALLVSDWKRSAAYHVRADTDPVIAIRNLPSPADIGYDARRDRVLVPQMTVNRVEFHPVPKELSALTSGRAGFAKRAPRKRRGRGELRKFSASSRLLCVKPFSAYAQQWQVWQLPPQESCSVSYSTV